MLAIYRRNLQLWGSVTRHSARHSHPNEAPSGCSQAAPCVPYLSNYTATISNLSIFTSFLQTFEQVGVDTAPSAGFTAFAPTDNAWGRIEQILSEWRHSEQRTASDITHACKTCFCVAGQTNQINSYRYTSRVSCHTHLRLACAHLQRPASAEMTAWLPVRRPTYCSLWDCTISRAEPRAGRRSWLTAARRRRWASSRVHLWRDLLTKLIAVSQECMFVPVAPAPLCIGEGVSTSHQVRC